MGRQVFPISHDYRDGEQIIIWQHICFFQLANQHNIAYQQYRPIKVRNNGGWADSAFCSTFEHNCFFSIIFFLLQIFRSVLEKSCIPKSSVVSTVLFTAYIVQCTVSMVQFTFFFDFFNTFFKSFFLNTGQGWKDNTKCYKHHRPISSQSCNSSHCTVYSLHCTVYSVQGTVYTFFKRIFLDFSISLAYVKKQQISFISRLADQFRVQIKVYSIQCTVYRVEFTLFQD